MSDPRSPGADREGPSGAAAEDGRLVLTPALRVPGPGQPSSPDSALDEALLRRIVRDIIEEELQGEFGTRITRGVRKLVRAEVQALLAARDPD